MSDTDLDLYSAMQSGKPYKTYKKVVLGRVYVSAIDPFTEQQPTGIMLYGDPRRGDESCFIDMWNERDNLFFIKQNKSHLASGFIVEVVREVKAAPEPTFEQSTDEQLKEIINKKYLALQAILNKTSSEAVLYRMIDLARDMEKSEKIIGAIEARLSEVNTIKVMEKKEDGPKT